jgi:hypothetical protein
MSENVTLPLPFGREQMHTGNFIGKGGQRIYIKDSDSMVFELIDN